MFISLVNSIMLFYSLLIYSLPTCAQWLPGPYIYYKTHPTFVPSAINITYTTPDRSLLAEGYYFVAPHQGAHGWGPQIWDQDGELVWYGQTAVRKVDGRLMNAMNFQRCDYLGQLGNHLCFSEAQPDRSDRGYRSVGVNRVLNDEYAAEGEPYSKAGALWYPNPHEFQMLKGGNSFVQSVYQLRKMDLRPYAGKKVGYVYDGCFQEIDTRTREEIFVWCSFDYFPIWQTQVYLNIDANKVNISTPTGGKGTMNDPWDPVHLNSVDKNFENDYLVSSRHMNQVIKIAGPNNVHGLEPGTVIWRFNGYDSDFTMDDDLRIGYQHHARWISTTENETTFTVFDNRGRGAVDDDTIGKSTFKTIRINNVTRKAELLRVDVNEYARISIAQGSAQLLPNGNALAGWGTKPSFTEFSPDGTLLFHAEFYSEAAGLTNYRAFKDTWVGRPQHPPKLLAYCQTCNPFNQNLTEGVAPLVAYVSWNGATEVKSWKFYLSGRRGGGLWMPAGTFHRTGFETRAELQSSAFSKVASFAPYVSVEALDARGNVLRTVVTKTFVPQTALRDRCDMDGCFQPKRFNYELKFSRSDECGESYTPEVVGLILLFLLIEGGAMWLDSIVGTMIVRGTGVNRRQAKRRDVHRHENGPRSKV